MEQNVLRAAELAGAAHADATIHVPYVQLGPKPIDHTVDTAHLERCVSCEWVSVASEPPARLRSPALKIDDSSQLLLDAHLVHSWTDIQRVYPSATKENNAQPVLVPDRPWEDVAFGFYGTVLYDAAKARFRMWCLRFALFLLDLYCWTSIVDPLLLDLFGSPLSPNVSVL